VTRDGTTSTYDYDPNGNLTTINGATFGTFDAQDRMVSFTPPGGDLWPLAYSWFQSDRCQPQARMFA
jgi:hypothetical protein